MRHQEPATEGATMRLQLRTHVSHTDTEYGAVLLDLRSGEYFQLNPTGALVVRLLLAGHSRADAAAAMAEQYEVDPPQARQDIDTLLAQLQDAGLVTVPPPSADRTEAGA